ncbi:MAG: SDR family oxidoreductase [Planctomyces sp.]|nr:SDR family oxidoreductase [Planctomyces sp.]
MKTLGDLTGRRILVTGSSTGIGRAIALEAARGGADVILHSRSGQGPAEEAAEEIRALGRNVAILAADLGEAGAPEHLSRMAWNAWDGLEGCVCNAGVDTLTGAGANWSFEEKLARLLDVDVRASLLMCRDLGGRMREAGGGALVTIGWDTADRGMEGDSGELFAAAKNAVMGFSRSLALSLAPEVRVNCIAPGWIRTAWGETASQTWQARVLRETPLRRWGLPEDIARMARFLLSDDAAYVTGQVINVNGGAVR